VLSKAEEFHLDGVTDAASVVQRIKNLEARGFHFESADASVELMLRRDDKGYRPPFELLDFMVVVESRTGRGLFAEATVKLRVHDQTVHTVSEGNGPVNALDNALRKGLREFYPGIDNFHLADYKVRILDGDSGTAAMTRVLIDTANHIQRWSTVGASTNIIESSWLALADAVEYGLTVVKT
jgi:2-isopropylmalate synthase